MAHDNVQLVRKAFEAFVRRDVEDALGVMDPEIEFLAPATQTQAARGEPYRGHDGMRTYFDDVAQVWDELEIFLHEYHEVDAERILVVGRVRARAKDGLRVDEPAQWAWSIRGGKIVSGRVFTDRHEALRALGMSPAEPSSR